MCSLHVHPMREALREVQPQDTGPDITQDEVMNEECNDDGFHATVEEGGFDPGGDLSVFGWGGFDDSEAEL